MIIETERLILRPWRKTDVDDMVEGLNDFETSKNLTTPYPYQISHATEFISKRMVHKKSCCHFAIQLKNSDKVIGGTEASLVDGKIKGGIWLNKNYHGKGYGTEVFRARAEFAFEVLGVNEIENGFFDFNKKSWHMQEKIGYKIVGEKKNFSAALNKEVTEVITKLTKQDYYKNKH